MMLKIEDVAKVIENNGHTVEIRTHEDGIRSLLCDTEEYQYVVQFYPSEAHDLNQFGAIRFATWFADDVISLEKVNSFNMEYRFANACALSETYMLQNDVIIVSTNETTLGYCVMQWENSMQDFEQFIFAD
jgi:hypothetical protein